MSITISAFARSPDGGNGHARDMRVRWALEEAGLAYDVQLMSFEALKQPDYLALQPFGQIPAYEEDGIVLFESGAILLHIAECHGGLLPLDPARRAIAISWMFGALNTLEPPIVEWETAHYFEHDMPWYRERLQMIKVRIRQRFADLARALGEAEWLAGGFSAADILMVTVLRRLEGSGLVEEFPSLAAYVERGKARPAFQRAVAAQRAEFLKAECARDA